MSDKTADELILNNAPEGATHFDAGHCYWDLRRCNEYHKVYSEDGIQDFGWFETDENPDVIGLRSLVDIKRIAELENKLIIARSFIPQKDLVNYSMKLDELKGGDLC